MNTTIFNVKNISAVIIIILLLISISTEHWLSNSLLKNNIELPGASGIEPIGLWSKLNTSSIALQFTRILVILSLLSLAIGLYLNISSPDSKTTYIFFLASGILSLLGTILYVFYYNSYTSPINTQSQKFQKNFDYSWYLNLLAGIASVSVGVLINKNVI